jgi:hypothetical protein
VRPANVVASPSLALLALLAACGGASRSGPDAPTLPPTPVQAPEDDACALKVLSASPRPADPGAGMPADVYERALAPLVPALCSCTRRGDELRIEARIVPARGEVRARAPGDSAVDACLSRELAPGRFAPDKAAATAPLRAVLSVPLTVDRRREQLRDARAPRAPLFEDD